MLNSAIRGIASMATRQLLAELAEAYRQRSGVQVAFESVGGVDAARRVRSGEPFDVTVLAADAIDRLVAAGHVLADSRVDLVRSGVAIAVHADAARPDVATADALRRALLAARSVGYSTGPSGVALLALLDRWGIGAALRDRLVQAPAGVPVGALVARGEVELGFQQLSELLHLPGIALLGPMPPGAEIVTTFSGGVCATSTRPAEVRALLDFMRSPAAAEAKRRHGMDPA
ncbi:MAG: substrate-binding domain-containing protein [Pseudomonadota bacterium]